MYIYYDKLEMTILCLQEQGLQVSVISYFYRHIYLLFLFVTNDLHTSLDVKKPSYSNSCLVVETNSNSVTL